MDPTDTPQFARMAKAIEYLYDHAAEQPDLAEVAAQVHLSPAHLQREFQTWAGISPKKMLQYISASRAKAALKRHESVAEVLATFDSDPGPLTLPALRDGIDYLFSHNQVEDILSLLDDGDDWRRNRPRPSAG